MDRPISISNLLDQRCVRFSGLFVPHKNFSCINNTLRENHSNSEGEIVETLVNSIEMILIFIQNVLKHNTHLNSSNQPPYEIITETKIDWREESISVTISLDDRIVGIIAGAKFDNVKKLIKLHKVSLSKYKMELNIEFQSNK